MSKFTEDLAARIFEINKAIPTAKLKERRALQKERADLENKLRKAMA